MHPQHDRAELGTPTWVATDRGHVAAWVHLPADGTAKGSVVLVPAADREQVVSYRAWTVLARELARAGQAVVRFAFRGDGDSDELAGDDVVASWRADLSSAIDLAAALVPGVPVTLLGLRVGAAVAAASPDSRVGAVLCWEPASGSDHLEFGQPLDGGVELAGQWYSARQCESIRSLSSPDPERCLLLVEDDREVADRLYLLSCRHGLLPRASIARLVAMAPRVDARPVAEWQPTVDSVRQVDGIDVRERFVEVGPYRLPGIVTEPVDGVTGDAVGWFAAGPEPKDGPTGLWASCARKVATAGHASLRSERRGTGDALAESEDAQPVPYREQSVDDTVDAVALLRTLAPGGVVLVGLSASSWQIARAARLVAVDRIVLLNNIGWRRRAEAYRKEFDPSFSQRLSARRRGTTAEAEDLAKARHIAHIPPAPEAKGEGVERPESEGLAAVKGMLRDNFPGVLWRLLGRFDLVTEPTELLRAIPAATRVDICLGDWELGFWERARGSRAIERLGRGNVRVVARTQFDHALVRRDARAFVLDHAVELVEGRLEATPVR